jgi:type 1 glutamine amidotransferase
MTNMNVALTGNLLCASVFAVALGMVSPAQAAPKKVLVVTCTEGFRHSSIPTAERIIAELGQKSGLYTVEYARVDNNAQEYKGDNGKEDKNKSHEAIKAVLAEKMSPKALKNYDAVIFANTTGDLPLPDKQAFLDWIKSGKGFAGMHSATDTFKGHHPPDPYVDMIGGQFTNHDAQVKVQPIIEDKACPACRHLPSGWEVFDEIYQITNYEPDKTHSLLMLNKHPNKDIPGVYPISWCKEYGKGRVFYTSLGHREDVWDPNWKDRKNPKEIAEAYQQHILEGIKFVLGLEKWNTKPQKGTVE